MSSAFPNSPKLAKGTFLVHKDTFKGKPLKTIKFQYNPEELTRSLSPSIEEKGKKSRNKEPLKIAYPPEETIRLKIVLDATDYLEDGSSDIGIYHELSELELLLYPRDIQKLRLPYKRGKKGYRKVTPIKLPLILFNWGGSRSLPVNIKSISITEKAFDHNLNPIRAEVDIDMNVLTWKELTEKSMYEKYMWNVKKKKELAEK